MTRELSELEFKDTFGKSMIDISESVENPIDIWPYVAELNELNLIDGIVLEKQLVESVYRNNLKTFDHVLLPTEFENVYLTIIVNLKNRTVEGHYRLNLNTEYGIE